jgi:transposase
MSKSYLGIDVHKRYCVYSEIDAKGKVIRRGRFGNNLGEVSDFGSGLKGGEQVVLEPVLNYLWLLDQLESRVGSIHVATPHKVRVIAESKSKTDRYDSRVLAELLRTDFLPESYIPSQQIRRLRGYIRRRFGLVKLAVMLKNRMRHLLFLEGVDLAVADVSSAKAEREIKRLYISEWLREWVLECMAVIRVLTPRIKALEEELERRCRGIAEVSLLRTIPGVGPIWAATIYAEVADISRFSSRKAFAAYTGLVPSVRSSGEYTRLGDITHQGSRPLRTALLEASQVAHKSSPALQRLYARVSYRRGWQRAQVAVARKLAVIIYAMLTKREPFHSSKAEK